MIGIPIPEAVLHDRRHLADRRTTTRRHVGGAVIQERRIGTDRRAREERRETPTGHLRNALHMLYGMYSREALSTEAREALEATAQRMWLALADVQRLQVARGVAAAEGGAVTPPA